MRASKSERTQTGAHGYIYGGSTNNAYILLHMKMSDGAHKFTWNEIDDNGNKMNGIIKTSKLKQWLCDKFNSGGWCHSHSHPTGKRGG